MSNPTLIIIPNVSSTDATDILDGITERALLKTGSLKAEHSLIDTCQEMGTISAVDATALFNYANQMYYI